MSVRRTVTSQAELDAVLAEADFSGEVWIDSPQHVRIVLSDTRGKWVGLTGNSVIERATGNSVIERADGNSVIERATGNSVIKWADGNSVIERATGTTVLHGVYGSARVDKAGALVTAYVYSARATVTGGRVIDMTEFDWTDPLVWAEHNGLDVSSSGTVTVFKAVGDDLRSAYRTAYLPGETAVAADWKKTNECGGGLHFGATPRHAVAQSAGETSRYLACRIDLSDAIAISSGGPASKVKARACLVLHEVDIDGDVLAVEAVSA